MERFNLFSRGVTFAQRTVILEYEAPEVAEVVAFLFAHIAHAPEIPAHMTFQLSYHEGRYSLHKGETLFYKGSDRARFASALLTETGYHLADTCDSGLFFHGAGLSWQNQALLMPGSSGAGKTTLTTWLLSKGFNYLSDEFIFIPQNTQKTVGFPRPLNLKPTARPVLADLIDFEGEARRMLSHEEADIVPLDLITTAPPQHEAPLRLILFPTYQANSPFTFTRLTKAQTTWHLMQTLINARNLPGHGLVSITTLARTVPAYKVTYAHFDQIDQRLIQILNLTQF